MIKSEIIQLHALSPYAEGEWMKLKIPSLEAEADEQSNADDEPEPDRILRGPVWNYGTQLNEEYYNTLLYGKQKTFLLSQDQKVLRGLPWIPSESLASMSLAQYIFTSMKNADKTATALVEAETGRSLTYKELFERTVSLAAGLRHIGVIPGQVFSIFSFNSLEAQTMVLAILMIGGVTSVADPALNPVDMGANMRLSKPTWVFSECGKTLHKLEIAVGYLMRPRPPTIVVNSKHPLSTYHTFNQLLHEFDPEFVPHFQHYNALNLVFLLFTSGTTGVSKATLISERFFMRSRMFLESVFVAPGPKYTTLLSCPFFWISIMAAYLVHITDGHRVVLLRGHPSEAALISTLRKYNVMLWVTTPSSLMYLFHWSVRARCPHLRIIVPLGMAFTTENIIRVATHVFDGKVAICQVYGLTELGLVSGNTPLMNKIGSVGRPFFNVELKVVEMATGMNLGPNEEGELCFRSPSMMLEYFNNPTETANILDDQGFLHTGDIGYYDSDGYIWISGRIKELIRWRNYNIIPAEIELKMAAQPEVQEAVAFGIPHELDGDILTVAVILRPGYENADLSIIEARVNETLSFSRKIRGGIFALTSFPMGSTGKALKKVIAVQVMQMKSNNATKQ